MDAQTLTLSLWGLEVYPYGLMLATGCLAACGLLLYRAGQDERRRNAAALTCLLSLLLGLFLSRLVYVLAEVSFAPFLTLANALNLRLGGFSMYGALIGAVLGAALCAGWTGLRAGELLDLLTPSLFLFILFARLGEQYTALGISRPLVTGVLDQTFLAFRTEYDAYLRTYLLESAAALLLLIASLLYAKKSRPAGKVFLFGALHFGVWQTLFESLRFDSHLRFSFIGLQQLLSAFLFIGVMIYLAVGLLHAKRRRSKLAILSLCLLPAVTAAIIGLEFMIDRSQVNKWLSYAAYVAVLLVPSTLGQLLLKEERV